ncbi:toprim domain-containing protein [Mangrovimicrobium sediminis]|uniref:toprim domain-containing protein n=1 Tax=Mangrovimicrobium sediminis TaxID=2562682 RepID=UPI001436746A|nr:toprim domain-containing protein [Haliea sp. SAOS-164]
MFDYHRQFADAIFHDIGAIIEPIADGQLHRFDDPSGKHRNRACWYVFHLDSRPAGAYGNWRTGIQSTWRGDTPNHGTRVEREHTSELVRQAREKRERQNAAAAERAKFIWNQAQPATLAHEYLASKKIPAIGLRVYQSTLLAPLRSVSGELVNLQRIYPDGTKRFLHGGRVTGTFWLLGREVPRSGKLYIAEGVATAATIANTLHTPVVAAMTAGNILPVAQSIRGHHPELSIVIAADNDHATPGNPGLSKGMEAARQVQAGLTWPTVCHLPDCRCTDFNDTANCERSPQ